MITYLSRKLTKVSTNNFKIDINGISDPSEMCKNMTSAQILIYQPINIVISFSPEVHNTTLTLNPSHTRPSSHYVNVKPVRRSTNLYDVEGTQ